MTISESDLLAETNGPPLAAMVLSVAVTLTVNVPACVGVPEITPVPVLSVSPPGRPVTANV